MTPRRLRRPSARVLLRRLWLRADECRPDQARRSVRTEHSSSPRRLNKLRAQRFGAARGRSPAPTRVVLLRESVLHCQRRFSPNPQPESPGSPGRERAALHQRRTGSFRQQSLTARRRSARVPPRSRRHGRRHEGTGCDRGKRTRARRVRAHGGLPRRRADRDHRERRLTRRVL